MMASLAFSLIVWNVGQGQWVTARTAEQCLHFDTGGEFAPWRLIERACAERENAAFFSHWDWDHLSFVRDLQRKVKTLCVAARPGGTGKPQRERMIDAINECGTEYESVKEIASKTMVKKSRAENHDARASSFANRISRKKLSSNSASRIFILDKFLMPGDSTIREEEFWKEDVRLQNVRVLILGHHGSKTSTSDALLTKLTNARQAIASARYEKYGHPHSLVEMRLRMHGVALLRTEDWGSIIFNRR